MLKDFGSDEFQLHLESGRIQWRHDPYTPGVYNYKDLNDIKGQTEVSRKRTHSMGIEMEASDHHEEGFMKGWSKGQHHLLQGSWEKFLQQRKERSWQRWQGQKQRQGNAGLDQW